MTELSVHELLRTRDCRIPGCRNELDNDDPARGRYANMCRPCRRGETVPSRFYFATLPAGRRFAEHEPVAPASRVVLDPLSPREEEVLFAIADGLGDAAIADELEISIQTVKTYAKQIYAKLASRNRAHAVALAYHHGILVPPRKVA